MSSTKYTTSLKSDKPLEQVLSLLLDAKGPKGDDNYYTCRCPAHNDGRPSLLFKAIGDEHDEDGEGIVFKCFAGCSRQAILDALNLDEKDLHYRSTSHRSNGSTAKRTPPVTAFDLGVDKLIHPNELLVTHRVMDGEVTMKGKPRKGVVIPYLTEDGKPYARTRLRTAKTAKDGSWWNDNDAPLIPYGLNWLGVARKARSITIVEGESDCWTLWHHGFAALGIPGAENYKVLKLAHLKDIESVYIIQEPDDAGQSFPTNVKKYLDKIGYTGKVYIIDLSEFDAKDPNDLHKKNVNGFKAAWEKATRTARPMFIPGKEPEKPVIFSLQDLMEKELPSVKWVIPDLLPEGLFLLTGKPKLGKSWLGYDIALSIAWGGHVMGKIQVEKGEVLYLDLESNERRTKKRMGKLLANTPEGRAPAGLHIVLAWPRIDQGGAELLEEWIKSHPNARAIVVDTWTKLSPRVTGKQQSLYESQYDALAPLKAISDKYGIAIMAVHHNRKMSSDDVTDEISGSTGLTGSADGFWILKRERGQTDAVLHVIGRDIEEDQALAVNFDYTEARWKLIGNAEDFAKTKERQAIIEVMKRYDPQGVKPKTVSDDLSKNYNTIRNTMRTMSDQKEIRFSDGFYYLLTSQNDNNHSQSSHHSQSQPTDYETDYANDKLTRDDPSLVNSDQPAKPSNGKTDYTDYAQFTITPETSERYPYDVIASLPAMPKKNCLRGHVTHTHLPWYHNGKWELVCDLCYGKGLHMGGSVMWIRDVSMALDELLLQIRQRNLLLISECEV